MNRVMQNAEKRKSKGRRRNLLWDASGDQPAKNIRRRRIKLTENRPLFISLIVDAATAEVIGDEPVNENGEWPFLSPVESVYETGDEQMNDDMKRAAQVLAEKVFEACEENDGIVSLRVRLGLFYDHEVMGIDQHGDRKSVV